MSDIGLKSHFQRSTAQLPVDWYFDETRFQQEISRIFAAMPRYVGHELMVPELGDYYTLPQEKEGRVLVRNANGVELLSNVCRHRQAIMLNGRGTTRQIVCPLHRWTYDLKGELLGAPFFEDNPCLNLGKSTLQNWNGLLFESPPNARTVEQDLSTFGFKPEFDFSGYLFDHVEVHECKYNWKTFIEVYLEDYHVQPFHPGLGQFVSCENLRWEFGPTHSVQSVGIHSALKQPGTPTYQKWHEQVLRFSNGVLPKHGAVWMTYYPNVMLEAYPHVLVISTLIPNGPRSTTNIVEFYYPEEIALFEREIVESERAAYMETFVEDDEIALRMDAGREALMRRGENQTGPYQSPMEDGMQHFHEWYRRMMHAE